MRIVIGALVGSVLLVADAGAKRKREPLASGMYSDEAIVSVDSSGKWRALSGVTVRMSCTPDEEATGENQWRVACTAKLWAERNGKVIARQKADLLDIDFQAIGGNNGRLELELLTLEDVSLIALRRNTRDGDEQSTETGTVQILAIFGDELREVYRHQSLDARDPGPDGPESERERTTESLSPGRTHSMKAPSLKLSRATLSGEVEIETLIWDGKRFVEKPVVLPPPAAVVDPVGGKSIEPQLQKIFAGQPLASADLIGLSPAALGLLRNALYARHGRRFKKPELQAFFYSPRSADRGSKLLPRSVNPSFTEAMLDATDQQSLKLLLKTKR